MTQLKAVLFDLDGTLVDSARDLREAVNVLLVEEGRRNLSLDEVKSMIGDGAAKLVERAVLATGGEGPGLPGLVTRFLDIYEAHATGYTQAYPGARETLEGLKRAGLRMAVVTNKPHEPTLAILTALSLDGFFDAVVGGDTLPERKPHPAPILRALALLGTEPSEALMVGDNYHDVQAARAAGVKAFAVTYGYSHKPHGELGADRLIDALPELLALTEKGASA
jgi:phosphoglycolate phosphatase